MKSELKTQKVNHAQNKQNHHDNNRFDLPVCYQTQNSQLCKSSQINAKRPAMDDINCGGDRKSNSDKKAYSKGKIHYL